MKAGWRMVPLGEVCTVINGGTPKSNVSTYWGGNVNWLTPKDMGQMEGRHIAETPRKITAMGLDNCSARLVPAGSVIMSTRAPIGHLAINQAPMAFNQGCRGMIPGKDLDPVFLFHFLSASNAALNDLGTGTTFKELSATALRAFPIPLPPLDEQKRIVAVLDEAFQGVSSARTNAEANLADADELFGAALDRIYRIEGANWPTATLPSVCLDFGRGKSRHRPRNDPRLYDGPYPFIQTGDISRAGHLLTDFEQTYSSFGLQQSKLWSAGTVCVAIVGATIGESAVTAFDCCFPDSVIGMTPDPQRADAQFVEYALCCFKAELKEAGKGSARDNINLATFEARHFPMPDIRTQRAVVERLNEISRLKEEVGGESDFKLAALETLRQSLLQKAFSGELT